MHQLTFHREQKEHLPVRGCNLTHSERRKQSSEIMQTHKHSFFTQNANYIYRCISWCSHTVTLHWNDTENSWWVTPTANSLVSRARWMEATVQHHGGWWCVFSGLVRIMGRVWQIIPYLYFFFFFFFFFFPFFFFFLSFLKINREQLMCTINFSPWSLYMVSSDSFRSDWCFSNLPWMLVISSDSFLIL